MRQAINSDIAKKEKILKAMPLKMKPATTQQIADMMLILILLITIHLVLLLLTQIVKHPATICSSKSTDDRGTMMMNTVGKQLTGFTGHWFGLRRCDMKV